MDSLTQIVLGASVGEAALGRKVGNRAMVWGAIAGTIPDLDVISNGFMTPIDSISPWTDTFRIIPNIVRPNTWLVCSFFVHTEVAQMVGYHRLEYLDLGNIWRYCIYGPNELE